MKRQVLNPVGSWAIVYRGEFADCDVDQLLTRHPCIYFADAPVADRYATPAIDAEPGKCTSRVYPSWITMKRPFINQPRDAYLELRDVVTRLGISEAIRIANKFEVFIEATDQWNERLNAAGDYNCVQEYLDSPEGDLTELYFNAYYFLNDFEEVAKLKALGYDGAIHAGNGFGSEGFVEYCVFNRAQVKSIFER